MHFGKRAGTALFSTENSWVLQPQDTKSTNMHQRSPVHSEGGSMLLNMLLKSPTKPTSTMNSKTGNQALVCYEICRSLRALTSSQDQEPRKAKNSQTQGRFMFLST